MEVEEARREILFKHLKEQAIEFDKHWIDDSDVAFDAIELAMVEYAEQKIRTTSINSFLAGVNFMSFDNHDESGAFIKEAEQHYETNYKTP